MYSETPGIVLPARPIHRAHSLLTRTIQSALRMRLGPANAVRRRRLDCVHSGGRHACVVHVVEEEEKEAPRVEGGGGGLG